MKKALLLCFLLGCVMTASAQDVLRHAIDSMQYEIRDFRDSIRSEIRQYRDSVQYARRHAYDGIPHELRIGWGDQMFETLLWHQAILPTNLPSSYQAVYDERYRYTQHWFVEYLYNVNYWYAFSFMVDYSGVLWDDVIRDGTGKEINRFKNRNFHNICIMPQVRFSYLHTEYVSLYSALGVGLNINTGSEIDYKGRKTAYAPAINLSVLGLRIGKGRWFGAIELGGLISLIDTNEIYMFGSRIFTASVGCRL